MAPSCQKAPSQALVQAMKLASRGKREGMGLSVAARPCASPSKQRGQHTGRGLLQPSREDLVGNPVGIGDRAQRHEDGAVGKVRARDHVADAGQANGTRNLEQGFLAIGMKGAGGKTAARGDAAKRVGEPRGDRGEIVIDEAGRVGGRDKQIALVPWRRAQGRGVGIDQPAQGLGVAAVDFADPASPVSASKG